MGFVEYRAGRRWRQIHDEAAAGPRAKFLKTGFIEFQDPGFGHDLCRRGGEGRTKDETQNERYANKHRDHGRRSKIPENSAFV